MGRNLGYRNIVLEMDSSAAFTLVQQGVPSTHAYSTIIHANQRLVNEELCLIYREANRCADRLARVSHKIPVGMSFFDRLPSCISLEFLADSLGIYCPRMICV